MGSNPEETIVVENAPLGVKAGRAAGCFVIGVNTGPLPDRQLKDNGANVVFHDMFEVKDALERFLDEKKA